jgi:putative acetyltransferase
MTGILIRPCRVADPDEQAALARIFHRAVRKGAGRAYSRSQRAAWSPAPPAGPEWAARLAAGDTMVAERGGVRLGFMTLNMTTGFLDFAYVAPEAMGTGVADALYAVLEGRARVVGLARLDTEASRLAEPFLRRHGWEVTRRQEVERDGIKIPNAVMTKRLPHRTVQAA